jgi:hypothetical protein
VPALSKAGHSALPRLGFITAVPHLVFLSLHLPALGPSCLWEGDMAKDELPSAARVVLDGARAECCQLPSQAREIWALQCSTCCTCRSDTSGSCTQDSLGEPRKAGRISQWDPWPSFPASFVSSLLCNVLELQGLSVNPYWGYRLSPAPSGM